MTFLSDAELLQKAATNSGVQIAELVERQHHGGPILAAPGATAPRWNNPLSIWTHSSGSIARTGRANSTTGAGVYASEVPGEGIIYVSAPRTRSLTAYTYFTLLGFAGDGTPAGLSAAIVYKRGAKNGEEYLGQSASAVTYGPQQWQTLSAQGMVRVPAGETYYFHLGIDNLNVSPPMFIWSGNGQQFNRFGVLTF